MIKEKDRKMEEMINEILEDFDKYSTNISSETSRRTIARAIVRQVGKIYDYNIKYYYS